MIQLTCGQRSLANEALLTAITPKYRNQARLSQQLFIRGGDTVRAKFIQIPVELLSDSQVSALELRLYAVLLRYGLEGAGWSQAGHQLLGKNCNCHPKTIARCLQNLQALGWITIQRVGLNRNSKIRCLKTVQKQKLDGANTTYQEKTPQLPSTSSDKKYKKYRRTKPHLSDVQEPPPHKPQRVVSKPQNTESRCVDVQFKEAQQALTTELSKNIRPASLHWFQNAIITDDDAEKLTISLGHDQVGWVEEQYSALLEGLMRKKITLRS